ncbi:hypothetical protein NL676_008403 [Syzygium grande]|nr:hypothetical protein NL676_008403 [Syzygium grande]
MREKREKRGSVAERPSTAATTPLGYDLGRLTIVVCYPSKSPTPRRRQSSRCGSPCCADDNLLIHGGRVIYRESLHQRRSNHALHEAVATLQHPRSVQAFATSTALSFRPI